MSEHIPPLGPFSPGVGRRVASTSRTASPATTTKDLFRLLAVDDTEDDGDHSSFTLLNALSTVSSLPSLPASGVVTGRGAAAAQGAFLIPLPSTPLRPGGGGERVSHTAWEFWGVRGVGVSPSTSVISRGESQGPSVFANTPGGKPQ